MLKKVVSGLKHIMNRPIESAVIILVISFSLFLLVAFSLLWNSKDVFYNKLGKSVKISLYLKRGVSSKAAITIAEKMRQNPLVTTAILIQPEEGMRVFAGETALSAVFSNFKENPLPYVIIVYPKIKGFSKSTAFNFVQELKKRTEVDVVKADMDWIERCCGWLVLWEKLTLILIFILSVNVFFIICVASFFSISVFNNTPKTILPYQTAWYVFVSNVLVFISVNYLSLVLQDKGIFVQEFGASFAVFIAIASMLLGFTSSANAASHGELKARASSPR